MTFPPALPSVPERPRRACRIAQPASSPTHTYHIMKLRAYWTFGAMLALSCALTAGCGEVKHERVVKDSVTSGETPTTQLTPDDSLKTKMCEDIAGLREIDLDRAGRFGGAGGWIMTMWSSRRNRDDLRRDGRIPFSGSRVRSYEVAIDNYTGPEDRLEVRTFNDRLPGLFCSTGGITVAQWRLGDFTPRIRGLE